MRAVQNMNYDVWKAYSVRYGQCASCRQTTHVQRSRAFLTYDTYRAFTNHSLELRATSLTGMLNLEAGAVDACVYTRTIYNKKTREFDGKAEKHAGTHRRTNKSKT